jgi:DNA-binding transcriptional LysR family regulator
MELRQLRYFVAVAEELHFGRAAKRLGMTQPPLSQQIRGFEEEVGCELLDRRQRRHVRLTPAGEALLPEARRLLREAEGLLRTAMRAARGETGALTIGFAASAMFSPARDAIRLFREIHPDVEVRLRELSTEAQADALRREIIDVAIMREPAPEPGVASETLLREPFVLAVPGHHPLGAAPSVRVTEIGEQPFVLFPREVAGNLYNQVQALFVEGRIAPRVVQEALEWQTIIALVDAGLGLSFAPASFRRLRIGDVRYVPLEGSAIRTAVVVSYRSSRRTALIESFLAAARRAMVRGE